MQILFIAADERMRSILLYTVYFWETGCNKYVYIYAWHSEFAKFDSDG